jgi:hypothetical protein
MGNIFCCTKKFRRDTRSHPIIGSIDAKHPIGMDHYHVWDPSIYDNVCSWADTIQPVKA